MTAEAAASRDVGTDVGQWLSRAAVLQFASLALQTPSTDVLAEMRELAVSLPDHLAQQAAGILQTPADEWEPEFFSVLGPAGCAVCESSYERAAQASRGPLLAQVAGYYEAFGYAPVRLKEVPDHAAVELGFLSFLAMKVAFAMFESQSEAAEIARVAYADFHRLHIGAWLPDCLEAIQATGSEQYSAIAAWVSEAVQPLQK